MKTLKYLSEYIFVKTLFFLFKLIGYEKASNLGEKIGKIIGPLFRPRSIIIKNLKKSNIDEIDTKQNEIINNMWGNYGRILAEYPFLKYFKNNDYKNYIQIEGENYLNEIIKNNKKVVFVSGHFNNFELMAMQIENFGINVAAIYRPLNNFFLNKLMEEIRIKYICKKQIKKGKSGTRELLNFFKEGSSIALMIDQRVSEGIPVQLFNDNAYTTTIPAQIVKKYGAEVVPIYIERINKIYFKMKVSEPINFEEKDSLEEITLKLNKVLEKMIINNPEQWIWSHNRWK